MGKEQEREAMHPSKRVVVAMSGGVDSSVAAALLHKAGYELIGLSVQTFDARKGGKDRFDSCCSLSDMEDARRVCEKLGVAHFVINAVEEFEKKVIENFVEEYVEGRTPSPCIHCNNHIKFDFLLKKARELGASHVATGHYARISCDPITGRYFIRQAKDSYKDQSYYLFGLTQEQLAHTIFPLGEMKKIEVRKLAESFSLERVSKKPDSHEICFIGKAGYKKFVEEKKKDLPPAHFVLPTKEKIPSPTGIHAFTVGQKKGLPHLLHRKMTEAGAVPGDVYVLKLDKEKEEIHIGCSNDLLKSDFFIKDFNWMRRKSFSTKERVLARIRSLATPTPAQVEDMGRNFLKVSFLEPQRAITPGQAVVLYGNSQEVLGGGWIRSSLDG